MTGESQQPASGMEELRKRFGVQCGEIVLVLITQEVGTSLETLRQCGHMAHKEGEIGKAKEGTRAECHLFVPIEPARRTILAVLVTVSPPVAESTLRETPRILLLSHMVLLIRRTLMNKPRIMLPCQEPRPSRLADCVSSPALSFTSSVALDKPLFLPRPLFPHVNSDSWGRVKERMQSGLCTWGRVHA